MPDEDIPDVTEDGFTFRIPFAVGECPNCGEVGVPGICLECGQEIPDTDGTQKLVSGRIAAFTELLDESTDLLSSYDQPPEPRTTVDLPQFYFCSADLDLVARSIDLAYLGTDLAEQDFEDASAIGGSARSQVKKTIEKVRALRDDTWEVCLFEVDGSGAELRDLVIEVGRWGASVVNCFLRVLCTADISEAKSLVPELKAMIDFPYADRLAEANAKLGLEAPNDDARIAGVVGRDGRYTDEFGSIDINALYGAFADSEVPLEVLSERAAGFFRQVLGVVPGESGANSLLLLPAVVLATLERPLLGHRTARLSYSLAARAHEANPQAFQAIAQRVADQAGILFSAASRIRASFRLLAAGNPTGQADSETTIATALNAYQEIGESTYRLFGWMSIDLGLIAQGKTPESSNDSPMIGSLVEQLSASSEPTAIELGKALDVELRNAVAHSRYEWDEENRVVQSLQSETSWELERLECLMDDLVAIVAGIDAGWACFFVEQNVELDALPAAKSSRDINLFAVTITFGSRGVEVTDFDPEMGAVYVAVPESIDPEALLPPLAGIVGICQSADSFTLRSKEAPHPVLLEIQGDVGRRASQAKPPVQYFAVLDISLSAMLSSGRNPEDALREIAIVGAKNIGFGGLRQIVESPHDDVLREISVQAVHWLKWLEEFSSEDKQLKKLESKLSNIAVNASQAEFGDQRYLALVDQLSALGRWAEKRGVYWPPRLGAY